MNLYFVRRMIAAAAVVGAVGALTASAQAQEARIGFVNTERIFRESGPARQAQQKLEAEFAKRNKELQDGAARVKAMSERLEKDGPTLSEAERLKRQREIAEQDRDLQRRDREFREDLNQRKNEELAVVLERANRVIRQIAETEKYDIIFQEAVYANPRIDITDKVIRVLNGNTPAAK